MPNAIDYDAYQEEYARRIKKLRSNTSKAFQETMEFELQKAMTFIETFKNPLMAEEFSWEYQMEPLCDHLHTLSEYAEALRIKLIDGALTLPKAGYNSLIAKQHLERNIGAVALACGLLPRLFTRGELSERLMELGFDLSATQLFIGYAEERVRAQAEASEQAPENTR